MKDNMKDKVLKIKELEEQINLQLVEKARINEEIRRETAYNNPSYGRDRNGNPVYMNYGIDNLYLTGNDIDDKIEALKQKIHVEKVNLIFENMFQDILAEPKEIK